MASSSGGMAEMIEDGVHGYVIDPHDDAALADRILSAVSDKSKLQSISTAAIARAQELTEPDTTACRMEANYENQESRMSVNTDHSPLVSVIIPFYNQSTTLLETLESVRASRYPHLEIDRGERRVDKPRLHASCLIPLKAVVKVDKPNGGLSSARNAGIRASKGAYFLPLDSDDLLHPDYIRKAVDALEARPELGYVTCYTRNFEALEDALLSRWICGKTHALSQYQWQMQQCLPADSFLINPVAMMSV